MAKGAVAKENLMKRFITALGDDYVGYDEGSKRYHFWSTEDGERMQVAVTMTLCKTPIEGSSNALDFTDEGAPVKKVQVSDDEQKTLNRLIEELGL